jgi:hypothetical protein
VSMRETRSSALGGKDAPKSEARDGGCGRRMLPLPKPPLPLTLPLPLLTLPLPLLTLPMCEAHSGRSAAPGHCHPAVAGWPGAAPGAGVAAAVVVVVVVVVVCCLLFVVVVAVVLVVGVEIGGDGDAVVMGCGCDGMRL